MRSITLIIAVAGAYALLRGWEGAPGLLLRACLAVATLVAGLTFWGVRRDTSTPRMFSLRKATWLDYLTLGVAIVFAEACFVVLTSMTAAPAQHMVDSFRHVVADPGKPAEDNTGNGGGDGDVLFGGHRSGDWNFSKKLDRPLPPNSSNKPSNKPEVFLELENAADATELFNSRIHLRSFAFSRFNGIAWSATRITGTRMEAPVTFPIPPKSQNSRVFRYRVYHGVSRSGQNLFTALTGVRSSDNEELTPLAESIYLLPSLDDPLDGYNYQASSSPVHFTDLISETLTVSTATPEELDLPPELADQLRETSEEFRYEPSLVKQLIGLKNYLQDNYTYSLTTENPTGANPLENFLYREQRGYCEHFATAAAMLCRTLGVPSRIAYGWSGGLLYRDQNMFVFRAKDAHAWTEIKLDGYGWVVFDTTPPDDDSIPDTQSAPAGEQAPDPQETIMEQQQQVLDDFPTDPYRLNIPPLTLYTGLGLTGLCCIIILLTRRFNRPDTTPDGRPLPNPPPGYLIHFKQASAALGYPMPTGRTLRQHVRILQQHNMCPPFVAKLLEYHYSTIYSGSDHHAATERQLKKSIRKWQKSVDEA